MSIQFIFFLHFFFHFFFSGGILRWKIDFAEMEIAAEMDNQDFDDGFI